jgi:hypothetical protein
MKKPTPPLNPPTTNINKLKHPPPKRILAPQEKYLRDDKYPP